MIPLLSYRADFPTALTLYTAMTFYTALIFYSPYPYSADFYAALWGFLPSAGQLDAHVNHSLPFQYLGREGVVGYWGTAHHVNQLTPIVNLSGSMGDPMGGPTGSPMGGPI